MNIQYKNKSFDISRRKEMNRAHGCKNICNYYDLSTEQVIGVLQLVLCTWIAAIGC